MKLVPGVSLRLKPLHFFYNSSSSITRETELEAIDQLQRKKLELEIESHALEREEELASQEDYNKLERNSRH